MRKWIPLLVVVAAFVASAMVYPRLPAMIPTHWNMDGQPDGWSGRAFGAWLFPVLMLGMWGLLRVLPAIDPRGVNYAKFGGAYEAIIDALMIFLFGMHVVVLRGALGEPVQVGRVVPFGIGVLLIVIGNLLPRCRPNWFIGIRTPWTLSSDRVWEKTHRLGGRLFVAAGLLIASVALFWAQWIHIVQLTAVVLATGSAVIYSYLEWKRELVSAHTPS
ncbi:MAG: SdpI family protein [Gemmatimonadaceae bacterium]